MTFWAIVRSPLFIGLDLSGDLDSAEEKRVRHIVCVQRLETVVKHREQVGGRGQDRDGQIQLVVEFILARVAAARRFCAYNV